jgi:O-antigen/teichoic acid export membrane protein
MDARNSHKGRTIAKNTLMLYFRMIFLMLVGFYTSRVVLDSLGENDFGIYGVVGGVVAMFSIISGALNSAVTRFLTFEMGKGEKADLNKIYSTSVLIQFALAFVIVVICEPVGIWFVKNEMTIAPDRIPAALWVLQFSLLSFVVNLMSVPQMASITAHEKMSAYAYIGILDGALRLGVALLIVHSPTDRLVWYSALMAVAVVMVRMAYGIYCRSNFPECRFNLIFKKGLLKEMFSFAGWNFIGVTSGVLRDQGGNILVNIFFTTAMNAARGVAVQLNGAVQGFVTNFMTAVNPQITKSYASGEHDYMLSLVKKSSRMAFFLLFIIALPLLFNTEYLLGIWLKQVPEHSASFVRLFLIFALSESISSPLITAQLATGNIRNYQIIVGGLQLLNLPVSYVFLKYGAPAQATVAVSIAISQVCLVARLMLLRKMIGLSTKEFFEQVYIRVLAVSAVALVLPLSLSGVMPEGFLGFCLSVLSCVVSAGLSILYVGCTRAERKEVISMVLSRLGQ